MGTYVGAPDHHYCILPATFKSMLSAGVLVSAAAAAQNDTTGNVASDQRKATPCDPIYISLFAITAWHVQLHTVMQQ